VLATVANACRDQVCLRFRYRRADGVESRRIVEPLRLVHNGWRWYLVAWDTTRDDWRTFRIDRITSDPSADRPFTPRTPPFRDAAEFVTASIASRPDRWQAHVILHASAEIVAPSVPARYGTVEEIDDSSCMLHAGGDWLPALAIYIANIGVDFTVLEPPELIEHMRVLADRLAQAVWRE
jgi:predicted DNA-binding transcriptional regulator YafY